MRGSRHVGFWLLLSAAALAALPACPRTERAGNTVPIANGAPPNDASAEPSASESIGTAIASPSDAGAPEGPKGLSQEDLCGRAVAARVTALPGAKPYTQVDNAHCADGDPFCDTVDKSPNPRNTCFVANDNIARAARESRGASGPALASREWDHKSAPKYLARIDDHLHLTTEEHARLATNGFVVLDRLAYPDYASAFHDVFQEQLPLFVGIDPILHAVFRGTELALERIERSRLRPALSTMLKKLRGALRISHYDATTKADLDVYLGVAWAFSVPPTAGDAKPSTLSLFGSDDEITTLTETRGMTKTELFGRSRMIDFSQLEPRGHYAAISYGGEDQLDGYFRAMMWLSRVELNLVSRGNQSSNPGPALAPEETPREARDAIALAELFERSGALSQLAEFEDVYTSFAGRREDVSPLDVVHLEHAGHFSASDVDAPQKLRSAIGSSFQRTARTHFTLEGAGDLPAIMTVFGPRIVPDVAPLANVVHDKVLERKWIGAGDVGYVLGHDRASTIISDFDSRPDARAALATARGALEKNAATSNDVYATWLRAILALSKPAAGISPSFTRTNAYSDFKLNSALVGYGQIWHTFVLLAAQGYDAYGCEIPDAYVEPLPEVYSALLAHVRGLRARAKGWGRLETTLAQLEAIVRTESTGATLSEAQRRWLGMVSEYIPVGGYADSGEPPKWTGWYFDLFEDREHGASKHAAFIADYFTLTNAAQIAYLGADGPRLAVFVVDTGGGPRAMVGPVAKGFELHGSLDRRLDDEASFARDVPKSAPWRASFAVPERVDPAVGAAGQIAACESEHGPVEWRVALKSARPLGATEIELLDHHGDAITAKGVIDVGPDWQVASFELPTSFKDAAFGVEAIHVRIRDLSPSNVGTGPFDYTSSPSVFFGKDFETEAKFEGRPKGIADFGIGGPPPVVPPFPASRRRRANGSPNVPSPDPF